jgi:hypothetical protein
MTYTIITSGGVFRDNDGACIPECPGNRDWDAYLTWCEAGNAAAPPIPPELPVVAEDYTGAVQSWLDRTVQANGYDNMASCVSYVNSGVDGWKADAIAAIAWRDAVWQAAYAMQADALAHPPAVVPTADQVIASLPQPSTFGWVTHVPGAGSP